MIFGPGCYDVTVAPFNPICDHPEIPSSKPMTFDVPMPSFLVPTPPNECVCFEFTSDETEPQRSFCNDAKCSVEIVQDGEDCCSGKYKVIPHIEFPCLPFTISEAAASVSFADATHPVGAKLTFENSCATCSILPKLEIVLPNPLIPDCFEVTGDGGFPDENTNATSSDEGEARVLGTPEQYGVRMRYKDEQGSDRYTPTANFQIAEDRNPETGCRRCTIGSTTIDITGLLNASGDVIVPAGGGGGGGGGGLHLKTDFSSYDVMYGGGYGDVPNDEQIAEETYRRGPLMKCGHGQDTDCECPQPEAEESASVRVLVADDITAKLVDDKLNTHQGWSSGTSNEDPDSAQGKYRLNMAWATGYQWHARGLAAVMSTFEFTPSGLLSRETESSQAVLLSPAPLCGRTVVGGTPFYFNASGLAMYHKNNGQYAAHMSENGLEVNCGSGLRIRGVDVGTPGWGNDWDYTKDDQGQLEVHYGPGFKVLVDKDATDEDKKYSRAQSEENGALHLDTGGAIWVRDADVPSDKDKWSGKRKKGMLEMSLYNRDFSISRADLFALLNDKRPEGKTAETVGDITNIPHRYDGVWQRDYGLEAVIPVIVPGNISDDVVMDSAGFATINPANALQALSRMRVVFVRITESGLVNAYTSVKPSGSADEKVVLDAMEKASDTVRVADEEGPL